MDPIQIGIEITKLVVTIFGAVVVAWYWNRTKDQLERYQYLDQSYSEILKAYFEHPQFGHSQSTSSYVSAFKEMEALRYHYFAMRVHTFLESVFDLSKGNIPDEWVHIYRYHRRLHSAWLQDHGDLHEPGYVSHVFD